MTKDGNPLSENKDYTVDYQMGEGARAYTDADKYNIRVNLIDGTEVANLEFCINPARLPSRLVLPKLLIRTQQLPMMQKSLA